MPIALGCRLTDADDVDRSPKVVRGSGGTDKSEHKTLGQGGQNGRADAPVLPDLALPPSDATPGIDGSAATIDTDYATSPIPRRINEVSATCEDPDRDGRCPGFGN